MTPKMNKWIGFYLLLLLSLPACAQQNPNNKTLNTSDTSIHNTNMNSENYYPFRLSQDSHHSIIADIESPDLFDKYNPIFEKHHYSGNGYSWEGHITQILEKENPDLLQHISFDPEAGGFYAYADNEENQKRIALLLSKVFQDMKVLESYLQSADKSRIDD